MKGLPLPKLISAFRSCIDENAHRSLATSKVSEPVFPNNYFPIIPSQLQLAVLLGKIVQHPSKFHRCATHQQTFSFLHIQHYSVRQHIHLSYPTSLDEPILHM